MARKKIKAEEIKEEKDLEIKEDEKDIDTEKVEEEVEEKADSKTDSKESKNLIVLSDGATVDENVKLSEEEADDLVKITKADGTEIFVQKVDGEDEEKKEIYEAIVEAEKPEDEVAEDLEEEVNVPESMEEVEEVAYVPAACHTAQASLNNSYYILKLKGGKIKALKAGKIFNKQLKASIINAYNQGKKLPEPETVFNKIAHKIGYTFGAFTRLASKLNKTVKKIASKVLPTTGDTVDMGNGKEFKVIASKNGILTLNNGRRVSASQFVPCNEPTIGDTVEINGRDIKITANKNGIITLANGKKLLAKQLVAAEIKDNISGTDNDKADMLKEFSIKDKDIKKDDIESEFALDSKKFDDGTDVKSATSKVKSLYNRLPSKSGVGTEVDWALKDFNKERNRKDKTMAAQIKSLRDATKELRAQKDVIASKEAEIRSLKSKLEDVERKEAIAIKANKIKQIIAALNIEDAEEKAAMTEKFAKFSSEQLDAVYETYTCCPTEEATNMHERMINEQMKKEASELAGYVPAFNLKEEDLSSTEDMEALVLEKEMEFQSKNSK